MKRSPGLSPAAPAVQATVERALPTVQMAVRASGAPAPSTMLRGVALALDVKFIQTPLGVFHL
jgi:hypothetical protein